jgi:hypothetical protein
VEIAPDSAGTIDVRIVRSQGASVLPERIKLPVNRTLQLSARGGNGAPGNVGGDGHDGRPGEDGINAMADSEATVKARNPFMLKYD